MNKGVISRIINNHTSDIIDDVIDAVDDGTLSEEDKNSLRSSISFVDDERMPYYIQDGKKIFVDVMYNSSSAIRRLNPGQLIEVEVNFIADQVRNKVIKAKTMSEKEEIIFKFIECINVDQATFFRTIYDGFDQTQMINGVTIRFLSPDSKRAFIEDIEKYGFYLRRPPHKPLVFDDVIRLYDAFPDITPVDIYVDLFGMRERKLLRKGVIGSQYTIILKQNSNKNFSARSTFRINRSNLPAKDIAKKTNRSSYARTPVRLSEIYNLLASVSGVDLAEYNIFMRSSALGRKSLDRIISASGNPLKIKKLKVNDNFTNTNADILAAKLKTLGLRIHYSALPEGRITFHDNNSICEMHFGQYTIFDYPKNREMYSELFRKFESEMNKFILIESYRGEKHDVCWDTVFEDEEIKSKYEISDDTKETLKVLTKGHLSSLMNKIKNANPKRSTSSDPSNPAPKKRGRKSKAEKEEELRRQMQLMEDEKLRQPIDEEESEENVIDDVNDEEPEADYSVEDSE